MGGLLQNQVRVLYNEFSTEKYEKDFKKWAVSFFKNSLGVNLTKRYFKGRLHFLLKSYYNLFEVNPNKINNLTSLRKDFPPNGTSGFKS